MLFNTCYERAREREGRGGGRQERQEEGRREERKSAGGRKARIGKKKKKVESESRRPEVFKIPNSREETSIPSACFVSRHF